MSLRYFVKLSVRILQMNAIIGTVNRKTHQNVFLASKITFSHLVVTSIVDINTTVILNYSFPVCKNFKFKSMHS